MSSSTIVKKPAGDFTSWLNRIRQTQVSKENMEVPCGNCRACCTSSYFIHIKPTEVQTISKIPNELLFAAPGLPKSNVLLGYDKNGHCPMFVDNECSIYEYRPQTCRDYDCRIFPATGLSVEHDKLLIADQLNRWQFEYSSEQDQKYVSALRSAAKFLIEHAELFPGGFIPTNPTQQAVLAIKVYEVFLEKSHAPDEQKSDKKIHEIVEAVISSYQMFERKENV